MSVPRYTPAVAEGMIITEATADLHLRTIAAAVTLVHDLTVLVRLSFNKTLTSEIGWWLGALLLCTNFLWYIGRSVLIRLMLSHSSWYGVDVNSFILLNFQLL